MIHELLRHETLPQAPRLEYGAVPLDPARVFDDDGRPYSITSLERITTKVAAAIDKAEITGWVQTPQLKEAYRSLLEVSLYDSQTRRMLKNRLPTAVVDLHDYRVIKAMNGSSSPQELLELLADYPSLQSIEMAKLSHPLDASATQPMDTAIAEAITNLGGQLVFEAPRYKLKTVNDKLPAVTILRKQTIGRTIEDIEIVSKKAFLVRGDPEIREPTIGRYIDRKVRHGFGYDTKGRIQEGPRFNELTEEIETTLPLVIDMPQLRWLQPIASSYYAKYSSSKNNA